MISNSGANNVEKKTGWFLSLSEFKDTLKSKPSDGIGLPGDWWVVERAANVAFWEGNEGEDQGWRGCDETEFVKMHCHAELGQKLKLLRPETKGGEGWCPLRELNLRSMKLRETEEKETESRVGGILFKDLRESLSKLKMSEDEKQKNALLISIQITCLLLKN